MRRTPSHCSAPRSTARTERMDLGEKPRPGKNLSRGSRSGRGHGLLETVPTQRPSTSLARRHSQPLLLQRKFEGARRLPDVEFPLSGAAAMHARRSALARFRCHRRAASTPSRLMIVASMLSLSIFPALSLYRPSLALAGRRASRGSRCIAIAQDRGGSSPMTSISMAVATAPAGGRRALAPRPRDAAARSSSPAAGTR